MSLAHVLAAVGWPTNTVTIIAPIAANDPIRARIMKFLRLPVALFLSSGCTPANMTSVVATPPTSAAAPLNEKALRHLFHNGYNTYLAPDFGEVIVDHPPHELFRPNGTYSRGNGRFGPDGWYTIEGDRLCVLGDGIPKQCRKVVPQRGRIYLLIDVSDNSETLMNLWQIK